MYAMEPIFEGILLLTRCTICAHLQHKVKNINRLKYLETTSLFSLKIETRLTSNARADTHDILESTQSVIKISS